MKKTHQAVILTIQKTAKILQLSNHPVSYRQSQLTLSAEDVRLIRVFKPKLQRLGVGIGVASNDAKGGRGMVEITHLPACMVEREAHELRRGRQSVALTMVEVRKQQVGSIYDVINGNESHVGKIQFQFFNTAYLCIKNATCWTKPQYNQTSGCKDRAILLLFKHCKT